METVSALWGKALAFIGKNLVTVVAVLAALVIFKYVIG